MVPVIKPYDFHSLQLRIEQSALHAERGEKDGTETLLLYLRPWRLSKIMSNPASLPQKFKDSSRTHWSPEKAASLVEEGFDTETGLFVALVGFKFTVPQNTNLEDARAALGRIKYHQACNFTCTA